MDMAPPAKASAVEAAGWSARMRGEPDVPPREYINSRDDFDGWLRGWDMANGRLKYSAYKRLNR